MNKKPFKKKFPFLSYSSQVIFKKNSQNVSATTFIQDIQSICQLFKTLSCQKIALCFKDSYYFSVALFACFCSCKIPILLPNNQKGTRIKFAHEYEILLDDYNIQGLLNHYCLKKTNHQIIPNLRQQLILFTSGSSGTPKKISRTLEQLILEITVLNQQFIHQNNLYEIYSTVSHQHVYGLIFNILWPLLKGNIIHLPMVNYPEQLQSISKNLNPVILVSSPAMLKRLSAEKIPKANMIIFSSGGPLHQETAQNTFNIFQHYPIEILGSTETGAIAYRTQKENNTIWTTLKQVQIKSDKHTQTLSVKSPFFNYVKAYFQMGDVVKLISKYQFELLDRQDRIVKIEEKRISLVEIEQLLIQHCDVQDAYAMVLQNHRQFIAVIIELSEFGKKYLIEHRKLHLNQKFQQYLANYFEPILLPKKFRYVSNIPTNAQGKHVLSELKNLF